ncbi:MAG: PAS domain S-box protein [Promethearchaeota archaeon]
MKNITNPKNIGVEIENNNKLWQITLDAMKESVFLIDLDYKVLQCNKATLDMFGKSSYDEIIGHFCWELVHGTSGPGDWCPVKSILESGNRESSIRQINGSWVEISSEPIFNDEREITGAVHIITDINTRKETEEKYKNIINNLMDIIIILDLKGNFQYISPQVYDISGFRSEELIGKNGFKIMHPDDINKAVEVLKDAINKKRRVYIEYRTIHKDGYYIDVSASGRIVSIDGEDKIFAIVRDITDQKRAEQKLKESEENFRAITEQSFMSILVIQDGLIKYFNDRIPQLSGYSREEIENWTPFEFLKVIHPEDKDFVLNQVKKKQSGAKDVIPQYRYRLIRKDKEIRWIENFSKTINYGGRPADLITSVDITDKINAEQKLKESEENFRTIAEQSLIGISILQDNLIKYANEKFADIFGYTTDDMVNWSPREFLKTVHPDNKDFVFTQATKKQDGSDDYLRNYIFKGIKKSGELIWIENYTRSIIFEGRPAAFVAFIDITDRKKAEEELRKTEERFRSLIENTTDAVFCYEFDHPIPIDLSNDKQIKLMYDCTLVDCNLACAKSYGFDRIEDVIGLKLTELFGTTPSSLDQLFRDMIEGGYSIIDGLGIEMVPNGEKRYFLNNGYGVIENNKFLRVWGTFRDITENKRAEQKLKESEEKFRKITEESLLAICIIQDDVIKYVNQEMANLYGYTEEEMLNWEPGEMLKTVAPESLETVREQLRKKQTGDPDVIIHYPIECIRSNGELFWVDNLSKTMIYEGRPADLVTQVDITERISAQQELVKLNQLKSELLRRTSHELKTPLVSIKGFSDLLLQVHRDKLDNLVISTLNEIKQGCVRLETLIADILKTAELESGAIQLNKSEEDLSFLVRVCVNEIKGLSRLRNHTINLYLPENLIIQFEKEQIHQVISNVLNNAVKYTPLGGLIEIRSEIENGFIILSIKDNGIGFTEEEKSRIFKQFGKIERYGQGMDIIAEGSGFGLFISKKIIELHGGDIWVESEGRNKGSTFFISFPLI